MVNTIIGKKVFLLIKRDKYMLRLFILLLRLSQVCRKQS
jgi:hypothetical protein